MMRPGNFGRPAGNFRGHPGSQFGGRQQGNMNNRNQGRFQQGGFQGNNYGRQNQGANNRNVSQSPVKREAPKVESTPPKPAKVEEKKETPKSEPKQVETKRENTENQPVKKDSVTPSKDATKTPPAQNTKKDDQVKTPQNGTPTKKNEGMGQQKQQQQKPNERSHHQGGVQQRNQSGFQNQKNQDQKYDRQGNQKGKQPFRPRDKEYNFQKSDGDQGMAQKEDKKFTGRCRLFVGNLTPDLTEEEFRKMFEQYGEVAEPYVSPGRGFGFIRLDYRHNAEAAKAALDGVTKNGRTLRVRFATHGAALKVKNLHPHVSNELLEDAFRQFGDLERAIVIVDDRGKSTGEGIVEFERKPGAQAAIRRINEGIFLLGTTPRPVIVEPLEQTDEDDGLLERFMNKNESYKGEREKEPRFAALGSFEYEFAQRWREIDELEKERIERVKKDMEEARGRLDDEMQGALIEYQAEQIRKDLVRQQEELRRLEEMRQQDVLRRQQDREMRQREEDRIRAEEDRRLKEMMMPRHGSGMDQGGRRREDMMGGMRDGPRGMKDGAPPLPPPPAPPAGMGLDRRPNQMPGGMGGNFSGSPNMGNSGQGNMGGGGNPGGMGNMPRQSRFDQPSGGFDSGFASGGGMGGHMGGPGGNMGGHGGPGMFNNQGMGGNNMGGGGPGMRGDGMDRRREGGPREDFGDVKRMRRY